LNPLGALFLVCVIDVTGFGIVVPLLPYIADRFGAAPWMVTAILASYSLCQLLAAPWWGRLSDRYGRRPILLSSMAGACLSYVLLGLAPSLLWLLLSRMLSGAMAGNLSAAMAYASDISKPAQRARALGTVGAAIALGFTIGPVIGGVLAGDSERTANFLRPALASVSMSLLAMLLVALVLRESVDAPQRLANRAAENQTTARRVLRARPALRWLVLAGLLVTFSQSSLESILGLWALKRFGLGPRTVSYLFFGLAIVAVLMQGGLVRVLAPRLGEQRLALAGIAALVIGLGVVALAPHLGGAELGLLLCGVGAGAYNPAGSALVSRQADATNRGVVMGVNQSGSSLARVLGALASGALFGRFGAAAPFAVGALVTVQASWCLFMARRFSLQAAHSES